MTKKLFFPAIAFGVLTVAVIATPQPGQAAAHCNDMTCPQWEDEACDDWNGFHCIQNGPIAACELCL